MAAHIPLPFNPQIPVTPPPDQATFTRMPLTPELLKVFAYGVCEPTAAKPQQPADKVPRSPASAPVVPAETKGTPQPQDRLSSGGIDPRHLAMASRIACYYQQRYQAVTRYQQHRCQAWANMHWQKCQETMQAAMLVVAWYVRDRIQRRRRRQRRHFRGGLAEKRSMSAIGKGQSVRRWITGVPEDVLSPNEPTRERFADQDETNFSMGREASPDKDSKLFGMADNLIKSQLSKIDVPLMGTLSFDESESESETEADADCRDYDDEGDDEDYEDYDDDGAEVYDDDGAEVYDDDGEDSEMAEGEETEDEEQLDSQKVQVGTGKGSRKRNRSSSGMT